MTTTPRPPASRRARSFPVTVTQLPVARCEVCGRSLAHRKGDANAVLTTHYERDHPDLLTT
ncbi:MAG: hypothetical protein ACKVZ6_09840 [Kineosporiaceae bacterium]|jgi:hypothetical protein